MQSGRWLAGGWWQVAGGKWLVAGGRWQVAGGRRGNTGFEATGGWPLELATGTGNCEVGGHWDRPMEPAHGTSN